VKRHIAAAALLAACGGGRVEPQSTAPETATAVRADDPLAAAAWLEGRWRAGSGAVEDWIRIDDTLYGIGLPAPGASGQPFEVLMVQRLEGTLVYTAYPGGQTSVGFPLARSGDGTATFTNPTHDAPQSITYRRSGARMTAQVESRGEPALDFAWQRADAAPATALEDADRAFAADVAARGIDGWVEWFEPQGIQYLGKAFVGRDAIRERMGPNFARPGFRIEWTPVASGMGPTGQLGYTVGRSRILGQGPDGKPAPPWCGSYVSVWRRQADGKWRVLFDTGAEATCGS
jgi:ketosteroid isomerase-like protein